MISWLSKPNVVCTHYNHFSKTMLIISLWNNSLISISILRDYWLVTMGDGHKHLLIYLDFKPEAWGWFVLIVCFYGAKVSICIKLEEFIR